MSAAVDQVAVGDEGDARDGRCRPAGRAAAHRRGGVIRASTDSTATKRAVDHGRQLGARGARRTPGRGWCAGRRVRRRPPPGPRRGRSRRSPRRPCVRDLRQQRRTTRTAATPTTREEEPRRPPGEAGDDPHRTDGEQGADRPPQRSGAAGARPRGCRRRRGRAPRRRPARRGRQRLVQRGVEQVGPQSALGAVDDAGPDGAADGVEHRPPTTQSARASPAALPARPWPTRPGDPRPASRATC